MAQAIGLAPHVHLADVEGDLVFLDARRDEYLCIARADAAPVRAALAGAAGSNGDPLLAELIADQLLACGEASLPWQPLAETARADLGRDPHDSFAGPLVLGALTYAAIRTAIDLRRPPQRWFEAQQRRRRSRSPATSNARVAVMARRFARNRALLPRSGRCLVGSLLLLHVLRSRGVTVDFVFAVRTHPFEAHCWIEHHGIVLTDTLEHVRWYTPIARF